MAPNGFYWCHNHYRETLLFYIKPPAMYVQYLCMYIRVQSFSNSCSNSNLSDKITKYAFWYVLQFFHKSYFLIWSLGGSKLAHQTLNLLSQVQIRDLTSLQKDVMLEKASRVGHGKLQVGHWAEAKIKKTTKKYIKKKNLIIFCGKKNTFCLSITFSIKCTVLK